MGSISQHKWLVMLLAFTIVLFVNALPAQAQTTTNTLHLCNDALSDGGVTGVSTTCTPDVSFGGGVVLGTTTQQSPTIGIVRSPNTNQGLTGTPSLEVAIFVPNNVAANAHLAFTVNFGSSHVALNGAVSSNAWTSGDLFDQAKHGGGISAAGFLGTAAGGALLGYQQCTGSCGPATQINQFLAASQSVTTGTTGYFVYLATVSTNIQFPTTNQFTFTDSHGNSFNLPVGSIFYSFVNGGTTGCTGGAATNASLCVQDTTAASSTVMIVPPVPEPGSMVLLGSGLIMIGGVLRRRILPNS